MNISDLAVPECDWEDLVEGRWKLKERAKVALDIVIKYHNDYEQKFGAVAKNSESGEIYGFYGDVRDVTSFVTVRLDHIAEIR